MPPHPIWDLITNLSSIIGYLGPLIVLAWVTRGYIATHIVSRKQFKDFIDEEFHPFKKEVETLQKALSERAITDAARNAKLEEQYLILMQILRKKL